MAEEPRRLSVLKRRLAFELMRNAALGASNSIAPRLDLLRRLSFPASEEFRQLETASQLAVVARRAVDEIYRDAWATERAPTDAQWRALLLLDRLVSRWSIDLANWIESEINERNFGAQAGKGVGDWIEWAFPLDVEIVLSMAADPDWANAIARPCISHRIPSGRVRTSVLIDDRHWDSMIQFDRYAGEREIVGGHGLTTLSGLSSDLLKEILLFVPEVAYLADSVEAVRLSCDKRQIEVHLAAYGVT